MKRWLLPVILLLFIGGGIATAIAVGDGWDDRHHDEVTRVVDANGDETIVIRDDRPFFPFGILFIPLFIFLFFGVMRAVFWRGRWGRRGPWDGGAPGWFDEWHRRAHEGGERRTDGSSSGTASTTGS
jgi:hypothetical protein